MNDYRIFPDQEPVDRRLIDVRKRKPMKRPNAGLRIRVLPGFGACASSLRVDAVLAKYSSLLSDIRIRNHLEALSCLTMVALAMPSSMAVHIPEARIVNADDQFQHDIKDPAESSKSTRLAKTARRHWPQALACELFVLIGVSRHCRQIRKNRIAKRLSVRLTCMRVDTDLLSLVRHIQEEYRSDEASSST